MPHELLKLKDTVKKTIYHPHDPIASVFSVVEEILDLAYITCTSYTQHQAINLAYVIIHSTVNLSSEICECNCMPDTKKMWVGFKQFFRTAHLELQGTTDITVQDAGTQHVNMVCNVVAGL